MGENICTPYIHQIRVNMQALKKAQQENSNKSIKNREGNKHFLKEEQKQNVISTIFKCAILDQKDDKGKIRGRG